MNDISGAVQALVNRMKEAPEEFFDPKEKDRWAFIYKETFREVLTEPEKAAIHTALREVRRKEFESKILKEILKVEEEEQEHEGPASVKYKTQGRFGQAQVKGQGQPVSYWNDPRMAMQREDLLRQQENLIRVGVGENGVNTVQSLSLAQRINGALNKMINK
jgi:hypothetical protein